MDIPVDRMVFFCRDDDLVVDQEFDVGVIFQLAQREGDDTEVQGPVQNAVLEQDTVELRDLDRDVRVELVELFERRRKQGLGAEGGDAEADGAGFHFRDVVHLLHGAVVDVADLPRVRKEDLAGRRGHHAPGGSKEKLSAELALVLGEKLGEGGLGDHQPLGGSPYGAGLMDREKVFDFAKFHVCLRITKIYN